MHLKRFSVKLRSPNKAITNLSFLLLTIMICLILKVSENEYTFNVDSKFVKIKTKSEKDHAFVRKIMEEKAKNTKNYIP